MNAHYVPQLVLLSIAVATLAAYTALELTKRVTAAHGAARILWLMGGGVAMGVGIWGMHFVGMLAFHLPVAIYYDPVIVGLSMAAGIAASALALWVASQPTASFRLISIAGVVMGAGIGAMHYTGMAALRMHAHMTWSITIVLLSVVYAVVASMIALTLFYRLRGDRNRFAQLRQIGAALVMGLAIAGLHYTGMAAASFETVGEAPRLHGISAEGLAPVVTVATVSVLVLALFAALLDSALRGPRTDVVRRTWQLHRMLRRMALATGAVGLVAIGAEIYAFKAQLRRTDHIRPWIEQVQNQRTQVLAGAALGGDAVGVALSSAAASNRGFEEAAELCRIMQEGGHTRTGRVMPVTGVQLVQQVAELCASLNALTHTARQRPSAQEFRAELNDFIEESALVEAALNRKLRTQARLDRWMSAYLLLILLLMTGAAAVLLLAGSRMIVIANAELQRLANIVEFSDDAVACKTLDGEILSWNRGAERMFGYTAAEMVGRSALPLVPPDCAQEVTGVLQRIGTGETVQEYESVRIRRDGTRLDVALTQSPILSEEDKIIGVSVVARDITAQKQVERAQLQAVEAAETASRTKSDFLANMSHEIRTPMNGILGMLDLALDTDLKPEQQDYISVARTSAESLLSVINDVLDFSKVEAGKFTMEVRDFRLSQALSDMVSTLGLRAEKKGVELALEIAPDVPDSLRGDAGRMRQVLFNLVGNAIKFTDVGEVVIRIEAESRTAAGTVLHFAVADTGIGIAAAKQELVFEAFAQADTSTTRLYGGTGLGLAISSSLVELMGGRIWVQSEVGCGSTFHFTLPLEIGTDEAAAAPVDAQPLNGLRVLAVDDHPTNLRIVEQILRGSGMHPTLAGSAREALQALDTAAIRKRPFNLILVDAMMPDIDGFGLIEAIKSDPRHTGVAVMMLSSAGAGANAARCRELGVAHYLVKPVRREQLIPSMLAALGGPAPAQAKQPKTAVKRNVKARLRVLLAEDNPVNQKLAVALLTKQGHDVVTVDTGKRAVQALEREDFDVVLMDVQMPEMGGLEATGLIRAREGSTGRRTPIIALTARAMDGDREQCLAAGMDGYLAKPVRAPELADAMDGLIEQGSGSVGARPLVWSEDGLLEIVDGDRELARQLIDLFFADADARLAAIDDAIQAHDASALEASAHALKGSAANIAAGAVSEVALQLECMGADHALDTAAETYSELLASMRHLRAAVATIVTDGADYAMAGAAAFSN